MGYGLFYNIGYFFRQIKQWKKDKEFERWKKEHPEEYERRLKWAKIKKLAEVNEYYLKMGYIKEPYKTYEEMQLHMREDGSHDVTKEELRQVYKNWGYSETEFKKDCENRVYGKEREER